MGAPQVVSAVLVMNTGTVLSLRITIALLTHNVVLQLLSARTKYDVLAAGVTVITVPVPMARPAPQPPSYHTQRALLAANPPFTRNVTDVPLQILSSLAVMLVADCESSCTFNTLLTHGVVLQVPAACTK